MAGNVGNWCHDWHDTLRGGRVIDPQGPVEGIPNQSGTGSPPFHVIRATSWLGDNWGCRCAYRDFFNDGGGDYSTGIRVVLAQAPAP